MNRRILPLFAALPVLLLTSGINSRAEKSSVVTPDAGVILSKSDYLPPAGTKVETVHSMTLEEMTVHLGTAARQLEGKASQNGATKVVLEFLAGEKIRCTLVSKTKTGSLVINGREKPSHVTPDPLEGQAVLCEKKDGKWVASLEAGSPTVEQETSLAKISKSFNNKSDEVTYGDAPHKVGDKWTVDASKLGSFADAEELSGTLVLEFLRIENFQGTPCAVLKSVLDIKGKTISEKRNPSDIQMRGELITRRSLEDMTDLEVAGTIAVSLNGVTSPGASVKMEGPMKILEKGTVTRP